MSLPTPKFNIGDVVFLGNAERVFEKLPCPDCNGTKTWFAVSPNGLVVEAGCPRCDGYTRNLPELTLEDWNPTVRRLTIGSIKIDTARINNPDCWGQEPVEYMCLETGVGSGSVYRESQLHRGESMALAAAEAQCAKARAERDEKEAAKVAQVVRCSVLHFKDSTIAGAQHQIFTAWHTYRRLREDIEEWLEKNPNEEVQNILEWDAGFRDPAPLEKLIRLINADGATMEDVRTEAAKVFG